MFRLKPHFESCSRTDNWGSILLVIEKPSCVVNREIGSTLGRFGQDSGRALEVPRLGYLLRDERKRELRVRRRRCARDRKCKKKAAQSGLGSRRGNRGTVACFRH